MLVFAAVFALYFVIQVLTSRRQDLKPLFVFGVSFVFSFAFKSLPYALATLNSLAELVSTRSHGGCNTSQGWPLSLIFEESLVGFRKNAEIMTLFPITGLIVLAGTLFNRQVRNISALVWSLLIFQIFSLGSLLCGLPGVSAINFVRHLIPYVQMSYLVLAIYFLSQLNFPKWTKRVSVLGFLLLVVPGLNRNVISVEHFKGKYLSERAEPNYSQIKNSVYNTAQSLSQSQDRRHFSPDLRLFPNFSSLLEIMDLRVVYPFYPRSVFDLNRSLVLNWQEAPAPDRPDRFVGINMETSQTIDPGLEKLLILHRVSMVSIGKGNPWLNGSVYGSKHCEIQIQDTVTDLYVCNHLQGVGFFPKQVLRFNDATEILEFFKTSAVADLVDIAAHAEPEQLQPAQGQILKIERLKDKIIYHLDVQSPGLFVYSDAWFSGWQTMVNDQPAKLTQVNQAFKGTLVPQGLVKLEYSFEKYY
jgi:hypothetical protein